MADMVTFRVILKRREQNLSYDCEKINSIALVE